MAYERGGLPPHCLGQILHGSIVVLPLCRPRPLSDKLVDLNLVLWIGKTSHDGRRGSSPAQSQVSQGLEFLQSSRIDLRGRAIGPSSRRILSSCPPKLLFELA